MGVLSALEMACSDIIGKEANKPVYKLLGGQVHERLRAYTYIYPVQATLPTCTAILIWLRPYLGSALHLEMAQHPVR
jgi:L-alanine-DL-glutamate epimerase-like enolase superfamily enzyme